MSALTYTVRDRSILLPYFKRFVVEPSIRSIPAWIRPNAITHVGHFANLAACALLLAFGPTHSTWPFIAAAVLLNFYNYCDNADGAHARRTKQCSATGELLDHGLDLLNTTYIALMAAVAVGASPVWTTVLAIVVPAACAVTYWEQAETGLFSLGLLNQIESVALLTAILAIDAAFGVDFWTRVHLGPISLRLVMTTFVCVTTTVGVVRNLQRVAEQHGSLSHVIPILAFDLAVVAAMLSGAVGPVAAAVMGISGNVFFGVRSLALRTARQKPRFELGVVVLSALTIALAAAALFGVRFGFSDLAASLGSAVFFGAYAIANTRDGFRRVAALDRA